MGINGLSIGIESGDDEVLSLVNKGYTSNDILEQCQKLDKAGIEYYFVYMTGLAGKGNGKRNAINSADIFNQLNPYFISIDSLTIFSDTYIHQMVANGKFIPAEEKERISELQTLIENLQIRVHVLANTVSNFYPFTAYLPYEREKAIEELRNVLESKSETEMKKYRNDLKSL